MIQAREISGSSPLDIIALLASSGLVSNAKMMYIKVTSHCLIHYQSIVGKLYTIKSEDKFTQSLWQINIVEYGNIW